MLNHWLPNGKSLSNVSSVSEMQSSGPWRGLIQCRVATVKETIDKDEEILPNALYVGVAALAGTILARNRTYTFIDASQTSNWQTQQVTLLSDSLLLQPWQSAPRIIFSQRRHTMSAFSSKNSNADTHHFRKLIRKWTRLCLTRVNRPKMLGPSCSVPWMKTVANSWVSSGPRTRPRNSLKMSKRASRACTRHDPT